MGTLMVTFRVQVTLYQRTVSFLLTLTPFCRCFCTSLRLPSKAACTNPSMVHYSAYTMKQITCHVEQHNWT